MSPSCQGQHDCTENGGIKRFFRRAFAVPANRRNLIRHGSCVVSLGSASEVGIGGPLSTRFKDIVDGFCALEFCEPSGGHRGAATFLLLFQEDRFPRRRRAGAVSCAHNAHATMGKQRDAIGAVSDSKLATGDPQQRKRPLDLESTLCRVEVNPAPAFCCDSCS